MSEYISVTTTTDSHESAGQIARTLLEARAAACVQISAPIESHYWWEGRIEFSREWHLTIKTRAALFSEIERTILALHPYTAPQILATPISLGNAAYLAWLDEATEPRP
jgi:periplasmic divalent cation tolerance protein